MDLAGAQAQIGRYLITNCANGSTYIKVLFSLYAEIEALDIWAVTLDEE